MNADNRSVVDNYVSELSQQVASLRDVVNGSVSMQNEHLQSVEKLCHSFQRAHETV